MRQSPSACLPRNSAFHAVQHRPSACLPRNSAFHAVQHGPSACLPRNSAFHAVQHRPSACLPHISPSQQTASLTLLVLNVQNFQCLPPAFSDTCTHLHAHTQACAHTYTCIHTHAHTHTNAHANYSRMHACTHVSTNARTKTHAHTMHAPKQVAQALLLLFMLPQAMTLLPLQPRPPQCSLLLAGLQTGVLRCCGRGSCCRCVRRMLETKACAHCCTLGDA